MLRQSKTRKEKKTKIFLFCFLQFWFPKSKMLKQLNPSASLVLNNEIGSVVPLFLAEKWSWQVQKLKPNQKLGWEIKQRNQVFSRFMDHELPNVQTPTFIHLYKMLVPNMVNSYNSYTDIFCTYVQNPPK